MAQTLGRQYLTIGAALLVSLAFFGVYGLVLRKSRHGAGLFLAAVSVVLLLIIYAQNDFLMARMLFVYIGVVTFVSIDAFFSRLDEPDVTLLFLLAVMPILLFPLGSDYAFLNPGGLVLLMALPASIEHALSRSWRWLGTADKESGIGAARSLIVASMAISVCAGWIFTYCEARWKHRLLHTVESPLARFVYTSRERSSAINELLRVSKAYVAKNDYVLAYDEIPMFYFLTRHGPICTDCGQSCLTTRCSIERCGSHSRKRVVCRSSSRRRFRHGETGRPKSRAITWTRRTPRGIGTCEIFRRSTGISSRGRIQCSESG
jgi:hypothetical protein